MNNSSNLPTYAQVLKGKHHIPHNKNKEPEIIYVPCWPLVVRGQNGFEYKNIPNIPLEFTIQNDKILWKGKYTLVLTCHPYKSKSFGKRPLQTMEEKFVRNMEDMFGPNVVDVMVESNSERIDRATGEVLRKIDPFEGNEELRYFMNKLNEIKNTVISNPDFVLKNENIGVDKDKLLKAKARLVHNDLTKVIKADDSPFTGYQQLSVTPALKKYNGVNIIYFQIVKLIDYVDNI